ncbi:phytoene/squalene synthase family protein [Leptolyngbya sp. 7M]|uniref:phytoene/squalene synthase family protein n=1 Tax=Leptolyngbya sp. 7M TaxID=2812896 RepID=UPI001B8CA8FE|nr:phytoene/squalene synthase family protein [Leptolyngbya sp. 7M]QYO66658.1 phytoene/squalene synthase family protein [Leptolyngbya sp. 7M]
MLGLHNDLQRNRPVDKRLLEGIELCRQITQRYGTSFYFATQFFPREAREGIYAVYAFARIPDEIVDDPNCNDHQEAIRKLQQWRDSWNKAFAAGESSDPVLHAIVKQFIKYGIPSEECDAFLRSMFMDEEKFAYANYAELEEYMYGSAGVIGLMVTRVVGYSSDDAFEYAKKLGYAFQLTNFLRDIREDHDELGRVYMPQDELKRYGLSNSDIASKNRDERFVKFMKFQIERNRQIYREALPGIKMLHWRGRLAVRISYVLYKAILGEIERANYNVFAGRIRTNKQQKIYLSLKALAGVYE